MGRGFDLGELGERGLVEALRRRAGAPGGAWRVGIGDDAAVLRPPRGALAVATDTLVEGVHFRFETTDARSLGHKALAVNLSDLGAMGARPLGCLLALGIPGDAPAERVEGFTRGLLAEARDAGCPLVGGDTVRSPLWTLAVTVLGHVVRGRPLLRRGARPGDRVLVTGTLGGAALGLHLLERGQVRTPEERAFARRQRRPRPPWRAGLRLARAGLASAAIDLSDGLLEDLERVLAESGVAAEIWLERLPLPRGLRALAEREGLDPERLALVGGEDYELLFTAPARGPGVAALSRRLGCAVTEIGAVRRGRGLRLLRDGAPVSAPVPLFQHFKRSAAGAEES